MTTLLWAPKCGRSGTALPEGLSDAAIRVVEAVRDGRAGDLFPVVAADGPEGTLARLRPLGGDSDAALVAQMLGDRRFAPLVGLLGRIDAWCIATARQYGNVVVPAVLDLTNADLFGPLISEAFVACATGSPQRTVPWIADQETRTLRFLTKLLVRLRRDLRSSWPDDPAWRGPVCGIWVHGEETHNGRQRVVRLALTGGRRLAYKPRPASGELLFLADAPARSIFQLLNELPPGAGPVRLPVLAAWTGRGADRHQYSWQEWIEAPAHEGSLRHQGRWRMQGARLTPARAARLWHSAAGLAAACFGFGVADMMGPNLVAGTRAGESEAMLYPIDLEVFFVTTPRLASTGLTYSRADSRHHHVGLENVARWCEPDGPDVYWSEAGDGRLALRRRSRSFLRETSLNLVGDSAGRIGYGPYLAEFLRGMFDAWVSMCVHRRKLAAFLADVSCDHAVRVVRRPTADYHDAILRQWLGDDDAAATEDFDAAEVAQLRQMDVPYFFRSAAGGPLLRYGSSGRAVQVPVSDDALPPAAAVREGSKLTLANLGVALRDAVEHVFDDLTEYEGGNDRLGVRFDLDSPGTGLVSFAWSQHERRVTYSWSGTTVRLRIDPWSAPQPVVVPTVAGQVRKRLVRAGEIDAVLRQRWADGRFRDRVLGDQLRRLTDAAAVWLERVVDQHGWPRADVFGRSASTAAARLVQHLEDRVEFQKRCLRLIRRAARDGVADWRDVAYVTDAIRVAEGRPQRYGTKFQLIDGTFEPLPIEASDGVDERRAALGLEPMAVYAVRLTRQFADAIHGGGSRSLPTPVP